MIFIRAMVRIFSFGERWNEHSISPHENILTIALIKIHYLYTIQHYIYKAIYDTKQHYATLYNSIQDYTTLYKAKWHHTTLYNVIQDYTTIYKAIRHCTTLYNVIQDYI